MNAWDGTARSPRLVALAGTALTACAAGAGFGTHRVEGLRGFFAEIAVDVVAACLFTTGALWLRRKAARIALVVLLALAVCTRGCAGIVFHTLGEPTADQVDFSGWIAWLIYPALVAYALSTPVVEARDVDRGSLVGNGTMLVRWGSVLLAVGLGGAVAVLGVHRPVGTAADAITLGVALIGVSVLVGCGRFAARTRRLVALARSGTSTEVATRALVADDEHLPLLGDGAATEVVILRTDAPAGGPFRAAREERALFRLAPGPIALRVWPPAWSWITLGIWLLVGWYHASDKLAVDKPPYEVATRFRHIPIERVGRGDPTFDVDGYSFWTAGGEVVSYEVATGEVGTDREWMLAQLPPTRSPDVVAERAAAIRHACTTRGKPVATSRPTLQDGTIRYECVRLDAAQAQTHTEPVAPQRYSP